MELSELMNSRDSRNLLLNEDCHKCHCLPYAAYFVPSALSMEVPQLDSTVTIKEEITSLNSKYYLNEYMLVLQGYVGQYGIKTYEFK